MSGIRRPESVNDVPASTDKRKRDHAAATHEPDTSGVSRRSFIAGSGAAFAAASAAPIQAQVASGESADAEELESVPRTAITITVNGAEHRVNAEDRWTLAELIRDHLGLTGAKIGCNRGECGACTVLVNGEPVYSCSTLAVWADGRSIVTVEGLERNGELTRLQQAFMSHNAPQCGFCTSGQLMTATALLERNARPTASEVRAALAGNLCRCSNYNSIVEAVLAAADAGGAR